METMNAPRWPSLAFRGAASVMFGIIAFAWPGITLAALTFLFGGYAFVDGVIALVIAAQRGARPHRWLLVLDGLLGVGAGTVTLFWPGITLLALLLVMGGRFLVMGAFQVAAATKLRRELRSPLYALAGVAAIAVGLLTLLLPRVTALVLVAMLAAYALVFGIMMLVLAFRMRRAVHRGLSEAPA